MITQKTQHEHKPNSCASAMRTMRCWWASARTAAVASQRLQRAIGVVYRPDTERQSHYFYTRQAQQYDAVKYIDDTSAVEPLHLGPVWFDGEEPKTFPSGMSPSSKCDENQRF